MAKRQLPLLPGTPAQLRNEIIIPYISEKPILPEEHVNRGNQISADTEDNIKPVSIGLQDIDDAIFYYFHNVIKPTVVQNNALLNVPVIYGNGERWVAVQQNGYYRDKNGKIMYPIILIRRTGFEKNRELSNKLDGNNINNFTVSRARYNSQNHYNPFNVLNNYKPSDKFYLTPVADYVTITYECAVFTNYIFENNKIIESIEFASDSYWGNKDRFQFRTYIDRFDSTNEYSQDEERIVKTEMNLTLHGYIVPDTMNRDIASSGKKQFYSKSSISISAETVVKF